MTTLFGTLYSFCHSVRLSAREVLSDPNGFVKAVNAR